MSPLDLRRLAATPEGELSIELSLEACFSATARRVRLAWDAQNATVDDSAGAVASPPSRAEVLALVAAIADAAARPESPNGSRGTTRKEARLSWSATADGAQREGSHRFDTSEWEPERIEAMLAERPELRERANPAAHCVVHAITALVEARLGAPAATATSRVSR